MPKAENTSLPATVYVKKVKEDDTSYLIAEDDRNLMVSMNEEVEVGVYTLERTVFLKGEAKELPIG